MSRVTKEALIEIFKEYFNLATVPFYWNSLEPQENKPRFEKDSEKIYRRPAPDLCLEYCEEKDAWWVPCEPNSTI